MLLAFVRDKNFVP